MTDDMFSKREIVYTKGDRPREIFTITDKAGNVIHKTITPLMVLFRPHDLIQVIVGAFILAVPLAYTEETWRLGEELGTMNIIALAIMSITFISLFVFYNIYRHHFKAHKWDFVKRVISIYVIAFCVVAVFITVIDKAPWSTDFILAIKRVIIAAVPASMSAAVADMVK